MHSCLDSFYLDVLIEREGLEVLFIYSTNVVMGHLLSCMSSRTIPLLIITSIPGEVELNEFQNSHFSPPLLYIGLILSGTGKKEIRRFMHLNTLCIHCS